MDRVAGITPDGARLGLSRCALGSWLRVVHIANRTNHEVVAIRLKEVRLSKVHLSGVEATRARAGTGGLRPTQPSTEDVRLLAGSDLRGGLGDLSIDGYAIIINNRYVAAAK